VRLWWEFEESKSPEKPQTPKSSAGSLRSFTAIRKGKGVFSGSFLRKDVVFAYVGSSKTLKVPQGLLPNGFCSIESQPLDCHGIQFVVAVESNRSFRF